MKPKPLILEPGSFYKILTQTVNEPFIPSISLDEIKKRFNEIIACEPDDEDNYDHEVDPVCSGINGDTA